MTKTRPLRMVTVRDFYLDGYFWYRNRSFYVNELFTIFGNPDIAEITAELADAGILIYDPVGNVTGNIIPGRVYRDNLYLTRKQFVKNMRDLAETPLPPPTEPPEKPSNNYKITIYGYAFSDAPGNTGVFEINYVFVVCAGENPYSILDEIISAFEDMYMKVYDKNLVRATGTTLQTGITYTDEPCIEASVNDIASNISARAVRLSSAEIRAIQKKEFVRRNGTERREERAEYEP